MSGTRLSIRLNLDKLNHKKAYDILSALPPRRKSEYIVSAIIRAHDTDEVLEIVRQVLSESTSAEIQSTSSSNGEIDNVAMDYLKSL